MSAKAGYGGVGGFGGISTMNQDQRQGRYHPHTAISRYTYHGASVTTVKCFKCGQSWEHPAGKVSAPEKCEKGDG